MKLIVFILISIIVVLVAIIFMLIHSDELTQEQSNVTKVIESAVETATAQVPSCDDNNAQTTDVYNPLTKKCEHKEEFKETSCGDGRCEANERCDETIHKTICAKDCSLECPALLIVHKSESTTENYDKSYSCFGNGCEEIDANSFAFAGKSDASGIKTIVTNLGEIASSQINANFFCEDIESSPGARTTQSSESISGIKITSYFDDGLKSIDGLLGQQDGKNSATYYLKFDTTNLEMSTKLRCVITIQSENLRNQQVVLASFYKPKE